jgi:hypothetical protein
MPVVDAVSANLVSSPHHVSEKVVIFLAPVNLWPVGVWGSIGVDRLSVGDQEERSGEAVLVENRNSVLELAAKPVVERERDYCWSVHCLYPQRTVSHLNVSIPLLTLNFSDSDHHHVGLRTSGTVGGEGTLPNARRRYALCSSCIVTVLHEGAKDAPKRHFHFRSF